MPQVRSQGVEGSDSPEVIEFKLNSLWDCSNMRCVSTPCMKVDITAHEVREKVCLSHCSCPNSSIILWECTAALQRLRTTLHTLARRRCQLGVCHTCDCAAAHASSRSASRAATRASADSRAAFSSCQVAVMCLIRGSHVGAAHPSVNETEQNIMWD